VGLSLRVATRIQCAVAATITTTTFPVKLMLALLYFLVDAAVVQNVLASAAVATSPHPFCTCPTSALGGVTFPAAILKTKLNNLGLLLIDNTQPQFPVAVSSPSSLSSTGFIC
jgi:hypothetical protein